MFVYAALSPVNLHANVMVDLGMAAENKNVDNTGGQPRGLGHTHIGIDQMESIRRSTFVMITSFLVFFLIITLKNADLHHDEVCGDCNGVTLLQSRTVHVAEDVEFVDEKVPKWTFKNTVEAEAWKAATDRNIRVLTMINVNCESLKELGETIITTWASSSWAKKFLNVRFVIGDSFNNKSCTNQSAINPEMIMHVSECTDKYPPVQ